MAARILDPRCKGRAKSGKPCRAAATARALLNFHANPNKASELGRIGGSRKRHAAAESADPLPTLDTAIAVRDTPCALNRRPHAGELSSRVASGLAPS
jgi:hypothetical protein